MKNRFTNIVFLILCFITGMWFYNLFKKECVTPAGQALVSQVFLDSLTAVANTPPDTVIIRDTIIIKKLIRESHPVPDPLSTDTVPELRNTYRDSIVNNEVAAWVNITTRGYLDSLSWEYRPVVREITKEVIKMRPVPVPYERKVPMTGFYGSLGAGLGSEKVIVSGGVMYLDKKNRTYGIEVGNFHETYIKFEYGIKF